MSYSACCYLTNFKTTFWQYWMLVKLVIWLIVGWIISPACLYSYLYLWIQPPFYFFQYWLADSTHLSVCFSVHTVGSWLWPFLLTFVYWWDTLVDCTCYGYSVLSIFWLVTWLYKFILVHLSNLLICFYICLWLNLISVNHLKYIFSAGIVSLFFASLSYHQLFLTHLSFCWSISPFSYSIYLSFLTDRLILLAIHLRLFINWLKYLSIYYILCIS